MLMKESNVNIFILVFIFCTLVVSGAFLSLEAIKINHVDQTIKSLKTVVESTSDLLHLWVTTKEKEVARIVSSQEVVGAFRGDESLVFRKIQNKLNSDLLGESVQGFYVMSSAGKVMGYSQGLDPESASIVLEKVRNKLATGKTFYVPSISKGGVPLHAMDTNGGSIPFFYIASPLRDGLGYLGSIILLINPMEAFSRHTQIARIGGSGETYAVSSHGMLITESRFDEQLHNMGLLHHEVNAIGTLRVADPGVDLSTRKSVQKLHARERWPLTVMAKSIQEKGTGFVLKAYRDYRGIPVFGYWIWDETFGFGLTSEIDESEAMQGFFKTRFVILFAVGVFILSVILLVMIVVSLRKKMFSQLEKMSYTDGLTDIYNRRSFDKHLENELRRAIRSRSNISLAMIDVDFFKLYNDYYGHQKGDDCLKQVAAAIKSLARRPADIAARFGGEEFCLVLSGSSPEDTYELAEECRRKVASLKLPHYLSEASDYVTISVGVVSLQPAKSLTPSQLIELADVCLYEAKAQGRNRVVQC